MKKTMKTLSVIAMAAVISLLMVFAVMADGNDTVYISVSDDSYFVTDTNNDPVAYTAVTISELASIDLNDYGLSEYAYDYDRDGSYDITALHLYIYVHEQLMGLDWSDVSVSGGPGSIYFEGGLFGFEDENLRYDLNGAYPSVDGWGVTADQIVLSRGDFLNITHYTSWAFWGDSATGFHYFTDVEGNLAHSYSTGVGETLSLKVVRSYSDWMNGGVPAFEPEVGYEVFYGKAYCSPEGSAYTDENGDVSIILPTDGTWYVWCDGGCGMENSGDIVSAPAFATVYAEAPAVDAPEITDVNNYTVTVTSVEDIMEIRYAIGHYTTGAEIRAAEKKQTLSAALVAAHTVDGIMTYDLPWTGEYTFWVRYNDGRAYFLYADVTEITPYLEADGLRLTVKDFDENYRDLWIAQGTWSNYSEIKNKADVKYQAAAPRLSNYFSTHDFTYTCANPGEHTVLVRYNDGGYDIMYIDLTVDVPEFDVKGLMVTVSNIPGVKVIRTAYGRYDSVAELKKADSARNYNNKTVIKDAQEYTIRFREEGEATIVVEYTNGYKHFFYYDIEKKTPTLTHEGNTVIIGDLSDLFIVRYAPGNHSTANGIKKAVGSKYLKPADINENGELVIEGLAQGQWSFMVQYNDGSCSFCVIDVE